MMAASSPGAIALPAMGGVLRRSKEQSQQEQPVQLCAMNCGRPASLGRNGHGVPYTTCCRGCALHGRHDARCRAGSASGDGEGGSGSGAAAGGGSGGGGTGGGGGGGMRPLGMRPVAPADQIVKAVAPPEPEALESGFARPPESSPMAPRAAPRKAHHPHTTPSPRSEARASEGSADEPVPDQAPVPPPTDQEIAMQLQLREVRRADRRRRRAMKRMADAAQAVLYVWDPIWGEVAFAHIDSRDPRRRRRQRIAHGLFSACPCIMVTCGCFRNELERPLTAEEVRRAWTRLLCSFSFVFGVVQVALLVTLLMIYHLEDITNNPMLGPSVYALDLFGAKNAAKMRYWNEWWRLLSPIVLHGGWLHLISNLLLQLRLSIALEILWGHSAWLFIYLMSGAYGNLASCIFMPDTLSVGSSGALCGLIGAWVPFILITWNQTMPRDVKLRNAQLTLVISSIVLLIPLSFLPMVDYAAHVGGLFMGAALSASIFAKRLQSWHWRLATRLWGALLLILLVPTSVYWFWQNIQPAEYLLSICPPPGCYIMVRVNATAPPQ